MLGMGTSVNLGRGSTRHPKTLGWAGGTFLARLGAEGNSRGWDSESGGTPPGLPSLEEMPGCASSARAG